MNPYMNMGNISDIQSMHEMSNVPNMPMPEMQPMPNIPQQMPEMQSMPNMPMPEMPAMPNMQMPEMQPMPNMPQKMPVMQTPQMPPCMYYMPQMYQGCMPCQSGMMPMQYDELETYYPRTYHIIHPHVKRHCDMMMATYGSKFTPSRQHFEKMIDEIYEKVEPDVINIYNQEDEDSNRQFWFGGRRRLLRDLIGILLLRELIGRRRRPFIF